MAPKETPKALIKSNIDKFIYAGGWDVRWDNGKGAISGFGVRIYPTGKMSYVFSYRVNGRKRLMVLGSCNAMTLEQARKRAKAASVNVDDGDDPLGVKQKREQGETFGDLAKKYVNEHAKVHKKTWLSDERRLDRHIPKSWNSRKAVTISVSEVSSLHARIGSAHPYEANRLLALLHIMFRLARMPWQFLPPEASNPAEGIRKFTEQKRKRFVTAGELGPLAKAIDQESNVYVRSAIWLYLLTGLRKQELLSTKWENIDYELQRIVLPDTKSGEEQYAPLSQTALAIIQATPRLDGNPYLLPGAKKGHCLVNISKPWGRIRDAARISDVRLHDLRRTVGSWLTQAGVDLNTIRDGLRHANISTTLTYARLGADPAREAMEEHGKRIMEAAGRATPLAVVGD